MHGGQFMAPTIVAGVTPDMAIARDEVFGPVLSVLTFDTIEEARRASPTAPYGLSAGVWSREHRHLHVGRRGGCAPGRFG